MKKVVWSHSIPALFLVLLELGCTTFVEEETQPGVVEPAETQDPHQCRDTDSEEDREGDSKPGN